MDFLKRENNCKHGNPSVACKFCARATDMKNLTDETSDWMEARDDKKGMEYTRKAGIEISTVWPQYYDAVVPENFEELQEAIAIRHKERDIRFKRDIRMVNGISVSKGSLGCLLDESSAQSIKMLFCGFLRKDVEEVFENLKERKSRWIFLQKNLLTMPQYNAITGKNNEFTYSKKMNYELLEQGDFFNGYY